MLKQICISHLSRPLFIHLFVDQKNGLIFDVWRKDGGSFSGREIDVKYHATDTTGVV